jgi:membrane protease YdiL (CAAX protease family)
LAVATVVALCMFIVAPLGLLWLVLLGLCAWIFSRRASPRWTKIVAAAGLLALAAGLMTHGLPGFTNPRVVSALRLGPDSIPFTLYLNFDKTAAGILILGFCYPRMIRAREWLAMLRETIPWALVFMGLLLVGSVAVGYVRFDPKWPQCTLLWVWVNLCFTCVAEEALFRGFIQARLQHVLRDFAGGKWIALSVAALAFGVAHGNGGATYVILASIAGFGYGWVFQRTGRIEASILTHFALNLTHFLLMSYPALQR